MCQARILQPDVPPDVNLYVQEHHDDPHPYVLFGTFPEQGEERVKVLTWLAGDFV